MKLKSSFILLLKIPDSDIFCVYGIKIDTLVPTYVEDSLTQFIKYVYILKGDKIISHFSVGNWTWNIAFSIRDRFGSADRSLGTWAETHLISSRVGSGSNTYTSTNAIMATTATSRLSGKFAVKYIVPWLFELWFSKSDILRTYEPWYTVLQLHYPGPRNQGLWIFFHFSMDNVNTVPNMRLFYTNRLNNPDWTLFV